MSKQDTAVTVEIDGNDYIDMMLDFELLEDTINHFLCLVTLPRDSDEYMGILEMIVEDLSDYPFNHQPYESELEDAVHTGDVNALIAMRGNK